jgi:hypothetical protein
MLVFILDLSPTYERKQGIPFFKGFMANDFYFVLFIFILFYCCAG